MSKYTQFEVRTPVTIEKPSDFMDAVISMGAKIFNGSRASNAAVRLWSSGELLIPSTNRLVTVDQDKLNYYHFSRVAENLGTVALDFLSMAQKLDSKLVHAADAEAGIDLVREIEQQLFLASGHCSLEGSEHRFNLLDVVSSKKYPDQAVFVLKQEPLLDDIPLEGQNLLEVVTTVAQTCTKQASPLVYELEEHSSQGLAGIEGAIPFARTKMTDPGLVDEFRATFTDQMFDPLVVVRTGATEIRRQF